VLPPAPLVTDGVWDWVGVASTVDILKADSGGERLVDSIGKDFRSVGVPFRIEIVGLWETTVYCTISTVSSRILKICWPRWPINFLLNSSDLKRGLFFWL
jgi:hypothetical protein